MWRDILIYIRLRQDIWSKLSVWLFFIIHVIAVWTFQHYMIENVWAKHGITQLTIICLFIILGLLPYSVIHKLNIKSHWYAIGCLPSAVVLTLLSQESFDWPSFLGAIVAIVVFIVLVKKQPKLKCPPLASNAIIFVLIIIVSNFLSNTKELTHYKYRIIHCENIGDYQEALEIGKKSPHTNIDIFNLRTKAMLYTNTLGDKLFQYPIPNRIDTIATDYSLTTSQRQDVILCNLLLQKKLPLFVKLLQEFRDIHSPSLPRYYKEALIVFLSQTINTDIDFYNNTIQANFNDFMTEMKSHSDLQIRSNICWELYSDTYFWYYFLSSAKQNNDN